ncbi:hypothetical protein [Embleya sp. NBC_00888]|uniref:hypothetical protein n=1 Tax=Embleya sp. NBC_00888 TaxID=2975960 RepID=UPI003869E705
MEALQHFCVGRAPATSYAFVKNTVQLLWVVQTIVRISVSKLTNGTNSDQACSHNCTIARYFFPYASVNSTNRFQRGLLDRRLVDRLESFLCQSWRAG